MAKQDKLKILDGREKDIYEAGLFLEDKRKLEAREERAATAAAQRVAAKYATEYRTLVCAQRDEVLLVAGFDQDTIDEIRAADAAALEEAELLDTPEEAAVG